MTFLGIRDYLKTILPYDGCWFGVGKMDTEKSKALCLYRRKSGVSNHIAIGGMEATGYETIALTLLLRWEKDAVSADQKALAIYGPLKCNTFSGGFLQATLDDPVPMGTDDKGIYEFVIDFDLYLERKD